MMPISHDQYLCQISFLSVFSSSCGFTRGRLLWWISLITNGSALVLDWFCTSLLQAGYHAKVTFFPSLRSFRKDRDQYEKSIAESNKASEDPPTTAEDTPTTAEHTVNKPPGRRSLSVRPDPLLVR